MASIESQLTTTSSPPVLWLAQCTEAVARSVGGKARGLHDLMVLDTSAIIAISAMIPTPTSIAKPSSVPRARTN